jgi:Sulfotransferase family
MDPYAAESPGNAVQALARYWTDHASAVLAAEERFPDRCHRVRYEDLVADPEEVANGIFRFIGVPPVQGISTSCFAPERERLRPADYKIWHTSQITTGSVGCGWSVPAALITPPVTATINDLADKLGYVRVDETWSVAETAPDLRRSGGGAPAGPGQSARAGDTRQMPRVFLALGDLLQNGLFRVSDRFVRRLGPFAAESFLVVATSPGAGSARWRVDPAPPADSGTPAAPCAATGPESTSRPGSPGSPGSTTGGTADPAAVPGYGVPNYGANPMGQVTIPPADIQAEQPNAAPPATPQPDGVPPLTDPSAPPTSVGAAGQQSPALAAAADQSSPAVVAAADPSGGGTPGPVSDPALASTGSGGAVYAGGYSGGGSATG